MKNAIKNNLFFLMILSWLIPGIGHYFLSRKDKAVFFFIMINFTFVFGLFLGGRSFFIDSSSHFTLLAFFAMIFNGAGYILSVIFGLFRNNLTGIYYDAGVVYNIVPGLLNFLVILDVMDIFKEKNREND